MPVHDWTKVPPGIFHDFHHGWTGLIKSALNSGVLPEGYYAFAEQALGGPIPDVITLSTSVKLDDRNGGVAIEDAPPRARFKISAEADIYAAKANRITVRHRLGEVVAIIEIVSPGNKGSQHALRSFVQKTKELLDHGIHLLIVDLFRPGPRDPQGIQKRICDEFSDEPFELPKDKPLTVAAYIGGIQKTAYVEPFAVGDPLPEMPIFLSTATYVPAPLETTYQATWSETPPPMKELILSAPR